MSVDTPRHLLSRRGFLGAALGLALAPRAARASSRPQYGGTLTVPVFAAPRAPDPVALRTPEEFWLASALFDTLYALDEAGRPVPRLADAPPAPGDDPNTLRVTLWPGLSFHDGAALDAEAVIASLTRLVAAKSSLHHWLLADLEGAKELRAGKAKALKGARAISSTEVSLSFSAPLTADELMLRLAAPPAAITRATTEGLTGAGPFLRDPKDKSRAELRLMAFAEHVLGRPFLDGVNARRYTLLDAQADFAAGSLALLPCAPLSPVKKAKRLTGPVVLIDAVLLQDETSRYEGTAEFRRAVAGAVDASVALTFGLKELLSAGAPPKSLLPKALLPKGAAKLPSFDPAKAARELASISAPAPAELLIAYDEDQLGHRGLAEQLREFLADVGAPPARELALDAASLEAKRASGGAALVVATLSPAARGPLALAALQAASGDEKGAASWVAKGGMKGASLKKQEDALASSLRVVPLGHRAPEALYQPRVRGLSFGALGVLSFADAWLEG